MAGIQKPAHIPSVTLTRIMCLYPRFIKNKRYLNNKKNGGQVPECKDSRLLYVPIGCGNCIECRTQKARQWQVRLHEELKVNKYAYFITLTFSNEALDKLCEETKTNECNAVCGLAVRRFLERWRKKHKRSIKHWLITELGHENTERIHLHGIIFNEFEITNEELYSIWQYGRTDTGKYCTERSINYIIKYVTKIDLEHKNFKAQIFCSSGLGNSFYTNQFFKNIYKYKPKNSIEYYTLPNGTRVNLPIYYRNKFYSEDEREKLWQDRLDKNTIFVRGIKCDKLDTKEGRRIYNKLLEQQQHDNISMGYGSDSKEWQKKDYNITLKMMNKSKK